MNEVTNMSEDNNDVRPDVLSALVAEIRSLREENARRNAELEERFTALELNQQQIRLSELPEPTASVTPIVPIEDAHVAATRSPHLTKRPKLRDIPKFGGDKSQWRSWKLETEGKLRVDKEAIGDAEGHFMYVFMSLEGKAKENVTTFAEMQTEKRTNYVGLAKRCDSLSSQMELLGQWKRPRSNTKNPDNQGGQVAQKQPGQKTEDRREDMMEWEPTPQASSQVNAARTRRDKNTYGYQSKRPEDQALLGKRAKWVEQAEMDARYREGRCLRCGRDNCRVERCPLAAPIRPGNATRRTQVNVAAPSRPLVTIAAIEEDEDTASPSDEDSD
ncbi:reverse transcriptase (RNA-dependent DNA polymerase) domain-containing protein [Metarhizium brunneum]